MLRPENSDYVGFYEPVARYFLSTGTFLRNGHPAAARPPGYPLILAGTFAAARFLGVSETAALTGLSVVCFAGAALLLFAIARTIWPPVPALLAPLTFSIYPCALYLTKQPNSETPFLAFLYGAVLFAWIVARRERFAVPALISGLLAGAAMLIRPAALLLGVILAAFAAFPRRDSTGRSSGVRRWLFPLLILAGNAAIVLPWEIWVYQNGGGVIPLATNAHGAIYSGLSFATDKGTTKAQKWVPRDVAALEAAIVDRVEASPSAEVLPIAIQEARRRPLATLKLVMLKMARSWFGTDSGRMEMAVLAIQIVFVPLLLLCLAMSYRFAALSRPLVALAGLLVLYFWGMATLVDATARYTIPVIGLLFVFDPILAERLPVLVRGVSRPGRRRAA
jgi:hypothetical protein